MSTTATELTRTVDGLELPAPGTWKADPAHTSVEAVAKHMMVTRVRGRIGDASIVAHIDEDPAKSRVEATLQAASLSTNNEQRDGHLMSDDFLAVERFPEITYRSSSMEHLGENRWRADGELTLRDVTRPVALEVEFGGVGQSPFGHTVAFFSGKAEINREDFGITWNQALETGGVLVSKTAKIEIEAQLTHAEA